jgi:predicted N-acetyltransferase YhbS
MSGKPGQSHYFTLAAHVVARETLAKRTGRGSPDVIPAILLARLALDRSKQGQGLGAELLWDALSRAVAANRHVAARLVVVDAVDERAASFYEHFGFEPIPGNPARLVQKLSSIEAALGS